MSTYLGKMPTVARQFTNYLSALFGGASTSSRVGSVETTNKPGHQNGATSPPMTTATEAGHPNAVTANGKDHNMANGSASPNGMDVDIAPQPRQRSLDSQKIMNWEPDAPEKELIKLTWSDDFDFLYELGSNIYVYIFTHNPECQKLFPAIHAHGDKYKESREFRSQALKFVQTISHAVKNLYHMNDLAPHLYRVGERHVKFADRGFKPEYWDIFLDAMEVALAGQIASIQSFDEEQRKKAIHVWRRLAFYIITHMKHGYFDLLEKQTNQKK